MKNIVRLALGVMLLTLLLVPAAVSAQGPLTYGSAWQVQNLEDVDGHLTITFFDENGDIISLATVSNDPIDAQGSNNYFAVKVPNLPSPFQGSAVIASDRELRVIHNLYANDAQGVLWAASSAGYTNGGTEIDLPLIMRNNGGYNTWFSVQNAGSEDTTVSVDFYAGDIAGNDWSPPDVVIKPGGAVIFDQAAMASLGTRFIGAAHITSDSENIVATCVELSPQDMMAYDGFGMDVEIVASIGSPDFIGPIFHYHNPTPTGYWSGVQVQNVGDQATDVTLEFVPQDGGPGVYCTETMTIDPQASGTFGTYSFYALNHPDAGANTCYASNGTNRFIGSVRVLDNSKGQPLNAIVNQKYPAGRKGASYSAFIPDEATQCISAPLIMARHVGYETAVTVYNNSEMTATVAFDYTGVGDDNDEQISIAPLKSKVVYNNSSTALTGDYVGSATICSADPDNKLLAIVNEVKHAEYGDSFYVYNGFNLDDAPVAP